MSISVDAGVLDVWFWLFGRFWIAGVRLTLEGGLVVRGDNVKYVSREFLAWSKGCRNCGGVESVDA